MTDEKNASPISAKDFVSAYVETHKTGGTIADLASRLERSVDQVRAKKNSLSAQMKERGIKLPSLTRMARNGGTYDEAAVIVGDYLSHMLNDSDVIESDSIEG
jgi:hypothetical protein